MIITAKNTTLGMRRYEDMILLALLDFPDGVSDVGIRGRVGRMSLSLETIALLLGRLVQYDLVGFFHEDDDGYKLYYHLTPNGWLKAATLELPP